MRIFCGLTGDANGIAAAVTNERGGVIATAEVTDDPYGYLALCRMWVRHCDLGSVIVADNGSTRALRSLAAAAGQSIGITDVPHISDPMDAAVHIAQMVSFGDLNTGVDSGASAELRKLLVSTHALINSEYHAIASFMEVIRLCHPAVLAAWDDPTDSVALEILRIMPDPAEAAETSPQRIAEALGDIAEPARLAEEVHKLARAAASRSRQPRPDPGVAGAISAAAESVLACERAAFALASSVAEHLDVTGQNASIPRPRRSEPEVAGPASPAAPPPPAPEMPQAAPEPPTSPLPRRSASETPPGGFPRIPDPPQFIEPAMPEPPMSEPSVPMSSDHDVLSAPASQLPSELDDEDDLLIFSQARSAWFKGPAAIEDTEEAWSFPADEGWRAAEAASNNQAQASETTTGAGLPRRVPQANLVPGSAILSDAPPAPINRDASALAARTAGYFRGWSRARRETVGAGLGS